MEGNRVAQVRTMALLFVGGAVLGAVAGILFTPKSGEETRNEIKDYASKVKGGVVDAAQRTKAGIEAALEKGHTMLAESKAA